MINISKNLSNLSPVALIFWDRIDYVLENGVILAEFERYGVCYLKTRTGEGYIPVFRYQIEGTNIEELDESSCEWLKAMDIIGFDKTQPQPLISVEDHLPELNQDVIVYRGKSSHVSGIYKFDDEGNPQWYYTGLVGEPTHWRAIPEQLQEKFQKLMEHES